MNKESVRISLMFPAKIAAALIRRAGKRGKMDFIRAAVAEKLARDYGENISPILTRGEQGRRTDLERAREERKRAMNRVESAENAFYKAKSDADLTAKMKTASANAARAQTAFLREAELLAERGNAPVADALSRYREAVAARDYAAVELRFAALCAAVNAAGAKKTK